jgi:catechol 2,3-dioxygenase-like lactoylglutathione lyase family enzyme
VCGFFHAGITVRDMEESLRFYRDALGLEVIDRWTAPGRHVAGILAVSPRELAATFLRVPGSDVQIELFEYRGIERHPASCRPCDWGAGHICLFVDDLDGLYAHLLASGYGARSEVVRVTRGSFAGAKVVYALDPDGYPVELFQRPG